jgi:hypothetical protein
MPLIIEDTYDINPICYFCGKVNKLKKVYFYINVAKQTVHQQKKRFICQSCGLNIYGYNIQ